MIARTWSLLLLLVPMAAALSAAGPETKYKAPRNEYGQPDLQGVWNFSSDVPLQRPAALGDKKFFTREELAKRRADTQKFFETIAKIAPVEDVGLAWMDYTGRIENLRTSLIVYPENGRLPKLREGVRRTPGVEDIAEAILNPTGGAPPSLPFGNGPKDGPEDLGSAERCLADGSAGPPLTPGFDNNYVQIIQSKDHVAVMTESLHITRIVPLDATPHVSDRLRSWTGDSRGHWEGDTLVIETRNFNRRTRSFDGAGNSYEKVVTERFSRISKDAIEYEATVVDPKTFEDKIVISYPMAKVDLRIYESACHEGNYSLPLTLAGARKEEQEAAKTKQ